MQGTRQGRVSGIPDGCPPSLAELEALAGLQGRLELPHGDQGAQLPRGTALGREGDQARVLVLTVVTVLLLVAPQRVAPDKGGAAGLAAEGPLGHYLGHVLATALSGPFPARRGPVLCFGLVPVHLVDVLGQAAGPLGVEAAEVALEGAVLAVDPAVHAQGGGTGAGVAAFGALLGVVGLVQPAVLQEVGPVPALEGAVQALEGVLDADV